jgi:amino acid transporter
MFKKISEILVGKSKDPLDREVFHQLSLVAFLAWVGLGADGLSSSAYGPEEAYRALGLQFHYLAFYLVIAVALTVTIISISYSQTIELFPSGGGGYVVATKLLGEKTGLVSGSALVVDYILTISISIAAGVDAILSLDLFPAGWHAWKLDMEFALALGLIWLNLRGIKESVQTLLPIFLVFIATHAVLIFYGVFARASELPVVFHGAIRETGEVVGTAGWTGLLALLLRAYSLGGGTYTGIEAVSNGINNLREPKVKTGRRTMLYMAVSLALTAGGILFCYMLWDVKVKEGNTLNAVLAEQLFGSWTLGGWRLGPSLVFVTLVSEGMLLFIAAQAGFVDGPNVLSNMAVDSWVPHRFANLSQRLVRMNGILVMGLAALFLLWLTGGRVDTLVVLYSINVFVTFTLSQLSMCVHWWQARRTQAHWKHRFLINGLGMTLTAIILVATTVLKFGQGGWVTLVITGGFIASCVLVRRHYVGVGRALRRLDDMLLNLPFPEATGAEAVQAPDPSGPTAVLLVNGYSGLGIHTLFSIRSLFRHQEFKNFVFVSVGRIDSYRFKGVEEIDNLKRSVVADLEKYCELARRIGYAAEYRYALDTDVLNAISKLCEGVAADYVAPIFFAGKLIFARENFLNKALHNQTAMEIQRRLLFEGHNMIVMPIRVL